MRGEVRGDAGRWRQFRRTAWRSFAPDVLVSVPTGAGTASGDATNSVPTQTNPTGPAATAPVSAPAHRPKPTKKALLTAYVGLTKPRIVELLLVTTVPAMVLAAGGIPPLGTALATLVGGTLAAAGANVLNCYIDRDIDRIMKRTANRTLPQEVVPPRNALIFGVSLGAIALVLLWLTTNPLATALAIGANLYYVVIYTLLLKRRTPTNTFWGCFCGAAPVLIGWAAITGSLSWAAWALFGVVFFWQLPHFYALAMRFREDYSAAGVPMLPVVAKPSRVVTEIMIYSIAMGACSIALWPLAGRTWLYGGVAIALALWALVDPVRLLRQLRAGEKLKPLPLFRFSIRYLSILSLAITVDALLF